MVYVQFVQENCSDTNRVWVDKITSRLLSRNNRGDAEELDIMIGHYVSEWRSGRPHWSKAYADAFPRLGGLLGRSKCSLAGSPNGWLLPIPAGVEVPAEGSTPWQSTVPRWLWLVGVVGQVYHHHEINPRQLVGRRRRIAEEGSTLDASSFLGYLIFQSWNSRPFFR